MENTFNEVNTTELIEQINKALAPIQHMYGLQITISEPKYSDIYFEAKLSAVKNGSEEYAKEERKDFFMNNCESIGLSKSHWDMEFTFYPLKHKCKVFGLDFHDEENPIIVQDLTDLKLYRTSPLFFLNSI